MLIQPQENKVVIQHLLWKQTSTLSECPCCYHKSVSAGCWLDIANQSCGQKEVSNNNIQAARRWAPQSHIACNDCGIDIYWDTWGCNKMLGNISTTSWGFIAYCVQTLFLSISRQHTKISADITLHIDCRRTITHHTERREQRSNTR